MARYKPYSYDQTKLIPVFYDQQYFTTIAGFVSSLHEEIVSLFRHVLQICMELELIDGSMFAINVVKLPLNADNEWSGTRADLKKKREKLEAALRYMVDRHRKRDKDDRDYSYESIQFSSHDSNRLCNRYFDPAPVAFSIAFFVSSLLAFIASTACLASSICPWDSCMPDTASSVAFDPIRRYKKTSSTIMERIAAKPMPFFISSPLLPERESGTPVCIIYISARYGKACISSAEGLKSIILGTASVSYIIL
jgi:hypothetical protein